MKALILLSLLLAVLLQGEVSSAMPLDPFTATSTSEHNGVLTITRGPQATNFNDLSSVLPVIMSSSEPTGASIVTSVSITSTSASTGVSATSTWYTQASPTSLGRATAHAGGGNMTKGPQSSHAEKGLSVPGAHVLRALWRATSAVGDAAPASATAYASAALSARDNAGYQPYGDPFDPPPPKNSATGDKIQSVLLLFTVGLFTVWWTH